MTLNLCGAMSTTLEEIQLRCFCISKYTHVKLLGALGTLLVTAENELIMTILRERLLYSMLQEIYGVVWKQGLDHQFKNDMCSKVVQLKKS